MKQSLVIFLEEVVFRKLFFSLEIRERKRKKGGWLYSVLSAVCVVIMVVV
jgi:hypothetical protein